MSHPFLGKRGPAPMGIRVKQLVLLIGALYFALVALTNAVNFIATLAGHHVTLFNSGNVAYIDSVTQAYAWPGWFDKAAVLTAAVIESIGAYLFLRALHRFRSGPRGVGGQRAVWVALAWNIAVWLAFIVGTEFFVAYQTESPFRELLAIALLMTVVMAVVPDDAGAPPAPAAAQLEHPDQAVVRR